MLKMTPENQARMDVEMAKDFFKGSKWDVLGAIAESFSYNERYAKELSKLHEKLLKE